MITAQTAILSAPSFTADQIYAWASARGAARLDFLKSYLNVLYQLGVQTGVNPDLAAFQSAHECGNSARQPWTSAIWTTRGNPAGIGVMGPNADQGISFATGTLAARAHIAHLLLYATGHINLAGLAPSDDQRYQAYLQAYGPTVQASHLADLAGKWAVDPAYASGILAYAADFDAFTNQKAAPMSAPTLTFGNVPLPAHQERFVTDAQSGAWDDLGPRTQQGVVWHRMEGTLWGTDGWFRRGVGVSDGLTEVGVGSANIDGAQNDGLIFFWNDPTGASHPGVSSNRAPWASGPVNQPYGDGLAFLQDHGMDLNVVNRDQVAIEISGDYTDPVSPAAIEAVCQLTAYYADQAKIPYTSFPIIPGKDYSFVRWHQEFTLGSGKVCPGQVVMDGTNQMISRIQAILKSHQEQPVITPVPPAQPIYIRPGQIPVADGTDKTLNGHLFYALSRVVTITADQAKCRAYADPNAGEVRKPLVKGQAFTSTWLVKGTDNAYWWVSPHGARIAMADTNAKLPF